MKCIITCVTSYLHCKTTGNILQCFSQTWMITTVMVYIVYILYNAPLSGGKPGPVDQVPLVQVQHAARRSLSQHHAGWRHWYDQLPGQPTGGFFLWSALRSHRWPTGAFFKWSSARRSAKPVGGFFVYDQLAGQPTGGFWGHTFHHPVQHSRE